MYYRDMTEKDGPTQVIAGSHVDPSLVPEGIEQDFEWPTTEVRLSSFCCRKHDAIVWDQARIKTMNFVFKTIDFVFKTMVF